jgi:hypothetical protein
MISVNYTLAGSTMEATDLAGAPGVRTTNWNNALIGGGNTTLDLADGSIFNSLGEVVNGLTISIFTGNGGGPSQRGNPPGGTAPALVNEGRMFRTVSDKFDGAEGIITLTGVPYSKYDMYFYVYPDAGGGGERGGYFSITNSAGEAQTRWLKGGIAPNSTIPLPNPDTGEGYLQSLTSTHPASYAEIQAGTYVVISGLTDPDVRVYYTAVSPGSGNVTGGDGTRRLKVSGFQIAEAATGTITNLALVSLISGLYSGNPVGFSVPVIGLYSDGSSVGLNSSPGISFLSSDVSVFTVSTNGLIQPGNPGFANVVVAYQGLTLTQQISVLQPTAVRPVINVDPILAGARGLQMMAVADFPDGKTDVEVTKYAGLSFSIAGAGVATVTTNGLLTVLTEGVFTLSANYAGVTGQIDGLVQAYDPPQPEGGKIALSFNIRASRAMSVNDLAGAPGVRVSFWNDITGLKGDFTPAVLEPGSIVDSVGKVVSDLRVSVTGGSSSAAGLSTRGGQSENESTMFNDVYDQFDGTPGKIEITGIPFSVYDAYFYAYTGDTDNRPGHFTIGDETHWMLTSTAVPVPDNDGNGYVEAVTPNSPVSLEEIPAGNFVRFSNLTARSLSVQFVADTATTFPGANGVARLKFSGFQLVGPWAPPLRVARLGGASLEISWPVSATNFSLKSNTLLNGIWNPVAATPVTRGDELVVTVPTTGDRTFFILQNKP